MAKRQGSRARTQPVEEASRVVWDFRTCPKVELGACFLYEYGRESKTVLEMSAYPLPDHRDANEEPLFEEEIQVYKRLERLICGINPELGMMIHHLRRLVPHLNLNRTSWLDLPSHCRSASALFCDITLPSFSDAPWNVVPEKADWPSFRPPDGWQLVPIMIRWSDGFNKVLQDAQAWLTTNRPETCPDGERPRGRHATKSSYFEDGLRQLGALRLLAAFPLKRAIAISQGWQRREGRVDSIYSGYIDDDGRPGGQTAWDNAVKAAVKKFHGAFPSLGEEEPISYEKLVNRRDNSPGRQK